MMVFFNVFFLQIRVCVDFIIFSDYSFNFNLLLSLLNLLFQILYLSILDFYLVLYYCFFFLICLFLSTILSF